MDFLVEMSRRELDVSLELREEIIAGFGCDQSITVLNARDASQSGGKLLCHQLEEIH